MTVTPEGGPTSRVKTDETDIRLLFVYNADSGIMNSLKDLLHKNFSPSTYQCNLCALTFNNTGMRSDWAAFVNELGYPIEFLHRDELKERYGVTDVYLPVLLRKDPSGVSVMIAAEEINELWTLDELKGLVSIRVREMREGTDGS
jgi:hypothetical protein